MAELKVITQKLENKNHDLIGEVRGDVDVNMEALNFQINIFDKNKALSDKNKLRNTINDFYYNYFKTALKGTEWEFLVLEPISITGVSNTVIKIGDKFDKKEGVLAISAIDGDITKDIKITGEVDSNRVDNYNLTYEIKDSAGNSMTVIRTVTVRTNNPPIIKGIEPMTIQVGENFNPRLGVTAEDTEDGNLTDEIKITGIVNNQIPNVYNVTYEVTDKDGNLVSNIRAITVEEKKKETEEHKEVQVLPENHEMA